MHMVEQGFPLILKYGEWAMGNILVMSFYLLKLMLMIMGNHQIAPHLNSHTSPNSCVVSGTGSVPMGLSPSLIQGAATPVL